MKKVIKNFSYLLFAIIIFFLLNSQVKATMDITLIDDQEEGIVSVFLNSYDQDAPGIDMGIVFSEDITIMEISKVEDSCSFGFYPSVGDGYLTLECFNDIDTSFEGIVANISYLSESDDYFFYVDESTLDTGGIIPVNTQNVNMPAEADLPIQEMEIEGEDTDFLTQTVEFLRINYLYVIVGIIFLLSVSLLILNSLKRR